MPRAQPTSDALSYLDKGELLDGNAALLDLNAQDEDLLSEDFVGGLYAGKRMNPLLLQADPAKIRVVVRKRPLNGKELEKGDEDIIQADMASNSLGVNEPRVKVDLTAYTERHSFNFDVVLDEGVTNDQVYRSTVQPLVATIFRGGKSTCFAYGQTGSGKTYTMQPLPLRAAADTFAFLQDPQFSDARLFVSCFEIYGGKLFDLLNGRKRLETREDARKQVCIVGLKEFVADSVELIQQLIEHSNAARSTGSTGANDESSRSHSIMQFALKRLRADGEPGRTIGKISFIDLAGSERGADTYDNDRQTRLEGAEINKSLLALKECIRALDNVSRHVPFRGSKLTEVLRDSFIGDEARTVMIANISPAHSSVEHTLNTLRYADRVKELRKEKAQRAAGSVTPGPIVNGNAYVQPAAPPAAAAVAAQKAAEVAKKAPFNPSRPVSPLRGAQQQASPPRSPQPSPRGQQQQQQQRAPSPLPSRSEPFRSAPSPEPIKPPPAAPPPRRPAASAAPPSAATPVPPPERSPLPSRRGSRDASPPQRYYSTENEEDQALLYARDELMNSILQEEDELIAAHRKQIEDTMTIVRWEMNLLGEVDQPGSAIDAYVEKLAAILEQKGAGIRALQRRLEAFQSKLREEEIMSHTVGQRRGQKPKK